MPKMKCPVCAEVIQAEARLCRHCKTEFSDADVRARLQRLSKKRLLTLASFGFLLFLLFTWMGGPEDAPADLAETGGTATSISADAERSEIIASAFAENSEPGSEPEADPEPLPGVRWEYQTSTDPQTGRTIYFATQRSSNSVDLGWPYGRQYLQMTARQHPRYGDDVYFSVGEGQILCQSYENCFHNISVNGANERLTLIGADSGDSSTVFAVYTDSIRRMVSRGGDNVAVELRFYSAGPRSFHFAPAKLEWPPKNPETWGP